MFIVHRFAILGLLVFSFSAKAMISYDADATPELINGMGNDNGAFTIDRSNGVEVALRAKLRFNDNHAPENTFNSNGDGTYTYHATVAPGDGDLTAEWGFEFSANSDYQYHPVNSPMTTTGWALSDLTYQLGLDGDPSEETDFYVYDPITPGVDFPLFDHALGDNETGNGGGTVFDADVATYTAALANNNVAQNSWRYAFFPNGPIANFNAKLPGTYTLYLEAYHEGNLMARTEIEVIVVKPDLEFDDDATPDIIFGGGNANGAFTVDRRNGIETALRGKLRFNDSCVSNGMNNSNGDGTYSFDAGIAQTGGGANCEGVQTPKWSFEWSVNSDYRSNFNNNLSLSDLTYELGLDADPSLATDFLTFDPISPSMAVPFWDHAIGDNNTANGGGDSGTDGPSYQALLDNNNVAQNSWRYNFFLNGALTDFDPTVDGTYTIYLAAFDGNGVEVSRTQVQMLIGPSAVAGQVADVELTKTSTAAGTQRPGDTVEYTLTVTNTDQETATSVVLTDTLPDNLSFSSATCDDGSMTMVAGQAITINLADIPWNQSTTCTISAMVSDTGLIVNSAEVTAANDDDPSNNNAAITLLGIIESVDQTGDMSSPTDNDYTRINNAVQVAQPGDDIVLNGFFYWAEANAFDSWVLGSDGIADTDDDFSIFVPGGLHDLTITADTAGDATIRGPGDVPSLDLEGFLLIYNNIGKTGLEISNLHIENFDVAIGNYYAGGGINVYDGLTIVNNTIEVAEDIAGNSSAGESFQNIGIHYAFGVDITISGNTITLPGTETNKGSLRASSVGMQSNTSGNAYDGLMIADNEVIILNTPEDNPSAVLGIWENGNTQGNDVQILNNRVVVNNPGGDVSMNNRTGFIITSQTNAMTGDGALMSGNYVDGASIAYQWLSFATWGADYSDRGPLDFVGNTAINSGVGVRLDSNGAAEMRCNRFFNNQIGIEDINQDPIPSTADDNWWGCSGGPAVAGCDSSPSANVTVDSWLVANVSASPDTIPVNGTSDVELDVTHNNLAMEVTDCSLPDDIDVAFTADTGSLMPAMAVTASGKAVSLYQAPLLDGVAEVTATIDNAQPTADITIVAAPSITAVVPDPLPGNIPGYEATVVGGDFNAQTQILVAGNPRTTSFVDINTVTVLLEEADIAIMGETGSLTMVADNSASPGGSASAPFAVDINNDLLFKDTFGAID